ncbi:MAG: CDP-archaeol synthase [Marinobacter sp.]|nr:CDP-archaeol synthase [Marinobacter sp.]
MMLLLSVLLLVLVANGAPVLARVVFGHRFEWPVDAGRQAWDGRRWLGGSKTWRGLVAALVAAALVAWLLGLSLLFGVLVGVAAMVGDLTSSFIKRRLGIRSSGKATGLDQMPEALLPGLLCVAWFGVDGVFVLALVLSFMVLDMLVSPLLHRWGIRRQPH